MKIKSTVKYLAFCKFSNKILITILSPLPPLSSLPELRAFTEQDKAHQVYCGHSQCHPSEATWK